MGSVGKSANRSADSRRSLVDTCPREYGERGFVIHYTVKLIRNFNLTLMGGTLTPRPLPRGEYKKSPLGRGFKEWVNYYWLVSYKKYFDTFSKIM